MKGSAGVPFVAKGEISATGALESGEQQSTGIVANPRGLPQIVREIARSSFVLLVDDFHYIDRASQGLVAQALKEAVRQEVKIVTAAVTHRSDDVIWSLADLRGRVINVDLRYCDKDSLIKIAHIGFEKLHATLDEPAIVHFATEAAGSPQLMQAICLAACQEMDIREARDNRELIACFDSQLQAIFERIVTATNHRSLALCANVTETAPLIETAVEGEQEFSHDADHVQEERCLLRARGLPPRSGRRLRSGDPDRATSPDPP